MASTLGMLASMALGPQVTSGSSWAVGLQYCLCGCGFEARVLHWCQGCPVL